MGTIIKGLFAHFMADFCIHVCICTPQLITLKEAWNLTPLIFMGLSHGGFLSISDVLIGVGLLLAE